MDGRDPNFFRCEDFSAYTKEVGDDKMNILLINKSDLLSVYVREKWSTIFNKNGVDHVFFSAKEQQADIDGGGEEIVDEDYLEYKNTPKIVQRGSLKSLLKSLVIKYRQMIKAKLNEVIKEEPVEEEVAAEGINGE